MSVACAASSAGSLAGGNSATALVAVAQEGKAHVLLWEHPPIVYQASGQLGPREKNQQCYYNKKIQGKRYNAKGTRYKVRSTRENLNLRSNIVQATSLHGNF